MSTDTGRDAFIVPGQFPSLAGHGFCPCHCLCGFAHPQQFVCDALNVTETRVYEVADMAVEIPMCSPCAAQHDRRQAGGR